MKDKKQKVTGFLAKRSLSFNKTRNVFIIITIILAASLPSLYALIISAVNVEESKALSGMQHVRYMGLDESQIDSLMDDSRLAFATPIKIGDSFEYEGLTLYPIFTEADTSTINMGMTIAEGNYPTSGNEIATYKDLLTDLGYEAKLGQQIIITLPNGEEETLKVVGFFEGSPYLEKNYNILFSKDYADNGALLKNVDYDVIALLKNAESMSKAGFIDTVWAIGNDSGIANEYSNYNDNFANSLDFRPADIISIVIVSIIILFISVLVIYSVFYVSVAAMSKQFGQFRTIGMTSEQIKKMVNKEATILCFIGAPIGILISWIIAFALRPDGWSFKNAIIIAVIIFIANAISVKISILKPVKLASETSPIEASKILTENNAGLSANHKNLKNITPFSLAKTAVMRNKKKLVLTILSLAVGGILFMCATTLVASFDSEQYSRQGFFENAEFIIEINNNDSLNEDENVDSEDKFSVSQRAVEQRIAQPFDEDIIDKIKSIDGVKDVNSFTGMSVLFDYKTAENSADKVSSFTKDDMADINANLVSGELDYDSMNKNNEIIIVDADISREIYDWDFEIGDDVKIRYFNGEKNIEESFKIVAFVRNSSFITYSTGWFMVPQEKMNAMFPGINTIDTVTVSVTDFAANGDEVEAQLTEVLSELDKWEIITLREQLISDANAMIAVALLMIGITGFIIAFSLISLVNMLVATINSRKLEYAMLQSIGMSKKQLRTMIQSEGIIITICNAVITLVVGTVLGYVLVRLSQSLIGIMYLTYEMPILFFIGYLVVTMLVPVIIAGIMLKNIGKKSLVERLRDSQ